MKLEARSLTPGEIERGQDHEEEGHKTENEFYYTHRCRLFPLRQDALLLKLLNPLLDQRHDEALYARV
jgi:hypothetical protein